MKQTILITGGGTGGHLSVAKSFIDEFYKRDYDIVYIGSTKGQDRLWFENENKIKHKFFFDTKGVVNQNIFGKFDALWLIFKAFVKSIYIIKKYNIKKAISVGGFSAASGSFAAIFLNIDFYIHEQNSVMGKLNQITSKRAKELFSSYFDRSKIKDYPINSKFFKYQRVRTKIDTIIFLGGSQGATAINNFALQVATKLDNMNIKIIHQTGEKDFQRVNKFYQSHNIDVDIFDFSNNIEDKFHQADIAVSRSGASTMWELVANNLPTIFIPYPYASNNHQYQNAKFLEDKSLCFLFTQDQFKTDNDYIAVVEEFILKDLKKISQGLKDEIKQDGIKKIVNDILSSI